MPIKSLFPDREESDVDVLDPTLLVLYKRLQKQYKALRMEDTSISPSEEYNFIYNSASAYEQLGCPGLALKIMLQHPITEEALAKAEEKNSIRQTSSNDFVASTGSFGQAIAPAKEAKAEDFDWGAPTQKSNAFEWGEPTISIKIDSDDDYKPSFQIDDDDYKPSIKIDDDDDYKPSIKIDDDPEIAAVKPDNKLSQSLDIGLKVGSPQQRTTIDASMMSVFSVGKYNLPLDLVQKNTQIYSWQLVCSFYYLIGFDANRDLGDASHPGGLQRHDDCVAEFQTHQSLCISRLRSDVA